MKLSFRNSDAEKQLWKLFILSRHTPEKKFRKLFDFEIIKHTPKIFENKVLINTVSESFENKKF